MLDRMRHAFFGVVPAVSCLPRSCCSPQEAFWGTTVPLDIPLRRTCPRLRRPRRNVGGMVRRLRRRGEVPLDHEMRLRVPAGVREGERFRFSVMPPGAPTTIVEVRVSIR